MCKKTAKSNGIAPWLEERLSRPPFSRESNLTLLISSMSFKGYSAEEIASILRETEGVESVNVEELEDNQGTILQVLIIDGTYQYARL